MVGCLVWVVLMVGLFLFFNKNFIFGGDYFCEGNQSVFLKGWVYSYMWKKIVIVVFWLIFMGISFDVLFKVNLVFS